MSVPPILSNCCFGFQNLRRHIFNLVIKVNNIPRGSCNFISFFVHKKLIIYFGLKALTKVHQAIVGSNLLSTME